MKFYKIGKKHFSFRNNYLRKEFNFSQKEVKELNNLIKEPWVKPGYDKLVF
jgi:hypothetical protein